MTRTILIVGQLPDPHIECVAENICALGGDVKIVDRLRPESARLLELRLNANEFEGYLRLDGELCDLASIWSVWWRVKPFTLVDVFSATSSLASNFADREWHAGLDALETLTPQARWMNSRQADSLARNKVTQLRAAQAFGFDIPKTVISNSPSFIGEFLDSRSSDEYIYKPLSWYVEPPDTMIFTSLVTRDDVASDHSAILRAPGIFQERVEKAYELRVTIIGEATFPVKIDSQARQETTVDWRRNQSALTYERCELPGTIQRRLVELNKYFGLQFGAYDLIVTPEGEYVFLEVNSMGQWLWLERRTGAPISQSVAEFLSS